MKNFLEMIETVRRQGIFYWDEGYHTQKVDPSHFFEMVEKAQPFVFTITGKETQEAPQLADENGHGIYKAFDAPFPVFSIEMLGGDITIPFPDDSISAHTHCILAYEIEPRKFAFYVYGTLVTPTEKKPVVYSTNTFSPIVEKFVERINSQAVGTETVRQKVKIGIGSTKRQHTIRRVVYVRPKSQKPEATGSRKIEWTHRFWRRGCWVNLKEGKLGKDRAGNYCVQGMTWRVETIVNQDRKDLPLITKTRVLVDDGE